MINKERVFLSTPQLLSATPLSPSLLSLLFLLLWAGVLVQALICFQRPTNIPTAPNPLFEESTYLVVGLVGAGGGCGNGGFPEDAACVFVQHRIGGGDGDEKPQEDTRPPPPPILPSASTILALRSMTRMQHATSAPRLAGVDVQQDNNPPSLPRASLPFLLLLDPTAPLHHAHRRPTTYRQCPGPCRSRPRG